MTSVTRLFELLAKNGEFVHERLEIASYAFGELRRTMGAVIKRLSEFDDPEASEIANAMRAFLFSWLTSPVAFDLSIRDAINSFGSPAAFDARWGLQGAFGAVVCAGGNIVSEVSPLRVELIDVIRRLRSDGRSFTIYCHRRAREHFDTLDLHPVTGPLDDSCFLHSVREYSAAEPFHALIKVGPLRSKGWGAVPDAVKSAPRFERLIQLVWSGCGDDPSFGYDPIEPPCPMGSPPVPQLGDVLGSQIAWGKHETKSGQDPGISQFLGAAQDEFSLFAEPNQQCSAHRRAILLEIPDGNGILYPRSEVLSFDPNTEGAACLGLRVPGESLVEGMFVIQPQLGDVGFGETEIAESGYCRIWKQQLREKLKSSPDTFCQMLRNNGLNLVSLRGCVDHWARPPHTVIHAPQQRRHFKILIDSLAIDPDVIALSGQPGRETRPWWQRAWDEIRVSRGEAIQTGLQEHEIIEEQAMSLLNSLLSEVRKASVDSEGFRIQIPSSNELQGAFVFFKVLRVEDGFLVPETEIKCVRDLNTLEQWKVA